MVYYFSTSTRDRAARATVFPTSATKFLRLFTGVHHRTRRMSLSLSFSPSFLTLPAYTQRPVYAGCRSVSPRVSSQPLQRILVSLALRALAISRSFFLSQYFFLSLARALSRSLTVSSSFLSNVSALRLLSSVCLSVMATSEFESRRVEGLSRSGGGRNER